MEELIDRCEEYLNRRTPLTSTGRARKRMVEQLKKKCETERAYEFVRERFRLDENSLFVKEDAVR